MEEIKVNGKVVTKEEFQEMKNDSNTRLYEVEGKPGEYRKLKLLEG